MALRDKKDILIKYDNFKAMFFTGDEAESYKRVRGSFDDFFDAFSSGVFR